jgi:hypothetical protein
MRHTRRVFLRSAAVIGGGALLGCGSDVASGSDGGARDGGGDSVDAARPGEDAQLPRPRGPIQLTSWRNSSQELRWIYPSEESEAHWRHRRAPSGIPWTIPLGVLGGGYPYNFEILSGPEGLTVQSIGFDVGRPPFYYYLSLPSPAIGASTISIRVTDQNGASQTRTWSFEVLDADDTDAFLFFDASSGDNGSDGTRAAPKRDFMGWYLPDEDDATYRLHQCFYRGEFAVGGLDGGEYDSGVILNITDAKPRTHVGYGAGATWRGNGAFLGFESGAGAYIADVTYREPWVVFDDGLRRNQYLMMGNSALRNGAIFRVTFIGSDTENDPGMNPSCIMLPEVGRADSNYCIVGCVAESIYRQVLLKNYNGLDGIFEGWTVRNCHDINVVHHKGGDIRRWATRGILAIEGITSSTFEYDEWINSPVAREDLEVCWCSVRGFDQGRFVNSGGTDNWARTDSYRNNWSVGHHSLAASTGVFTFEDDVLQHSGDYPAGLSISDDWPADVRPIDNVTEAEGLLDPETNLRIGGPDGEHGCEMVFRAQR